MNILQTLNQRSLARGLQFIVGGDLAASAYGYGNPTEDMDLFVKRDDRQAWTLMFAGLRRNIVQEHDTFMQFPDLQNATSSVNIIFISDQTFAKMFAR